MSQFEELLRTVRRECEMETVSEAACRALGQACRNADDVRDLLGLLASLDDDDLEDDAGDVSDYYWRLRVSLSDAMAAAGEVAVGPLIEALEHDDPDVAGYAVRSLGALKATEAIGPIADKLGRVRGTFGKFAYIEALGRIGDTAAVPALLPHLATSTEFRSARLVNKTAEALGRIGGPDVVEPLAAVLRHDPQPFARMGALEGLAQVGSPAALAVIEGLSDPDDSVATRAAELAASIRGETPSDLKQALHSLIEECTDTAAASLMAPGASIEFRLEGSPPHAEIVIARETGAGESDLAEEDRVVVEVAVEGIHVTFRPFMADSTEARFSADDVQAVMASVRTFCLDRIPSEVVGAAPKRPGAEAVRPRPPTT